MIGFSSSLPGVSAAYGVQSSYPSASAQATAVPTDRPNVLSYLTEGDRSLLREATGVTLNAGGVDEKNRALAPAVAFMVAHDRKSGKLPEGQPLTSTYLRNMLNDQMRSGGAQDVVDSITTMLEVLATRGGHERLDLRT